MLPVYEEVVKGKEELLEQSWDPVDRAHPQIPLNGAQIRCILANGAYKADSQNTARNLEAKIKAARNRARSAKGVTLWVKDVAPCKAKTSKR